MLRLLAVEDHAANVALLRAVLRRASDPRVSGAELAVAGTLAEARAAVASEPPTVILLDMRLPDGSGLELLPAVGSLRPRPRVVVLTANALPADEVAARDAGADEFLSKPYAPADLVDIISRFVDSA